MIWDFSQPKRGDMIRVKHGGIYHYGIFISDDEIIQFGLTPSLRLNVKDSDVEVVSTDVDTFLQGGFLEKATYDKKELKKVKPVEQIVSVAKSRLGEKGYNILYNNCEHFCYQVIFGESYCSQTDNVRKLFQNMPILDVYIAKIPQKGKITKVYPKLREKEISACKNQDVKRQKYYAWKLLEYALYRSLGKKIEKQDFYKLENGKWKTNGLEFSISHSNQVVCVAISKDVVGVDIEQKVARNAQKIAEKILSDNELLEFSKLDETLKNDYIITKWSEKESLYKMEESNVFSPKNVIPTAELVKSQTVLIDDKYVLSIASKHLEKLRIYQNIEL